MAEPTISKVKEELTCAVCQDLFQIPKTLPCLHTFCQKCLKDCEEQRRKTRGRNDGPEIVECPVCRGISSHHEGIEKIITNFTLAALVDHVDIHRKITSEQYLRCGKCREDVDAPAVSFCYSCEAALCEFCTKMHGRNKEFNSHSILSLDEIRDQDVDSTPDLPAVKRTPTCSKHGKEQELKLYCFDCSEVICRDCTVTKSDHRDHNYEFIAKIIDDQRKDLKVHLEPLRCFLESVTRSSNQVQAHMKKLEAVKDDRQKQIKDAFNSSVKCLEARREELLEESSKIYDYKKKSLDLKLEDIEDARGNIASALDFASTTLEKGTDVEVLMYKADMISRSKTLQQAHKDLISYEPTEEDHIKFVCDREPFENFGMLWEAPCSNTSTAEGAGLTNPVQGEETEFTVFARGSANQELRHGGILCSVEVTCSPVITNKPHTIKPTVVDKQNGKYTVSYTPRYPGVNKVAVKFGDEHIQGSPFDVRVVRNYVRPFPEPSVFTIPNASPWGLAMISDTELAITASDCLVYIYSIDGDEKGMVRSNFIRPYGIATDHEGYLWLTDREAHTIQKFRRESNGEFVKLFQFGSRGVNAGQFSHPRGIAVNPDTGYIYISDMKNNRIQIYKPETSDNPTPQYHGQFGGPGKSQGCFNLPAGLCFDQKGHLVVCDDHNCRLQVFDPTGRFLYDLGTNSAHKGLLCSPIGIATDCHGRYIITEFGSHCISFMSPEGKILSCVRTIGKDYGQFVHPRGVTVDSSGYVYVADHENMRIARF